MLGDISPGPSQPQPEEGLSPGSWLATITVTTVPPQLSVTDSHSGPVSCLGVKKEVAPEFKKSILGFSSLTIQDE